MTETAQSGTTDSGGTRPSALLTFLIADVRGYTRFTLEHGDEAAARLASRFAELVEEGVSSHGGRVIELRGDEALAVFSSARGALRSALDLQQSFRDEGTANLPLTVGIGLDAGEAIPVQEGYRGAALNLAARLCSLAGPGEVLTSETVANLARKTEGVKYADRGQVQLKGFVDPVMVMEVVEEHGPEVQGAVSVADESESQPRIQDLPFGGFLGALPANPLVGRGQELAQVLAAADDAATGAGRLIVLAGEPGAGKTRLAQEVTLHLRNRGFLVAAGRCYEPEQTVPYYPFLDSLAMVYAAARLSLQRDAARRWPYMGALLPDQIGAPAGAGGTGEDEQQRIFRTVTNFLEAIAGTQPLAILLDDLHWADSASLKLLLHLARHTRTMPILLLGTYREAEVGRQHPLAGALRDLHRNELLERVDVRRLDEKGTAALVASTMGEGEVSHEFAALLHGWTEGNPYFVQWPIAHQSHIASCRGWLGRYLELVGAIRPRKPLRSSCSMRGSVHMALMYRRHSKLPV